MGKGKTISSVNVAVFHGHMTLWYCFDAVEGIANSGSVKG